MYSERYLRAWTDRSMMFLKNRTLKALKLDHLKPEDFKVLKSLGIKRQNIRMLNKLITTDSDEESDVELIKPFKELK